MPIQFNNTYLYPPGAAFSTQRQTYLAENTRNIAVFGNLASASKRRAISAYEANQQAIGHTSALALLMPREPIDIHVFPPATRLPPLQPGAVWPTQDHDGLFSGMEINAGTLGIMKTRFEHLGWRRSDIDQFIDTLAATEAQIFSKKDNPRPRKLFLKVSEDSWMIQRLQAQWEVRSSAIWIINELHDKRRIPVHIYFTPDRDSSNPYEQKLVFVFPESNDQVKIWRHVFYGESLPLENVFNHQHHTPTSFAQPITHDQVPPPAYDSALVWQSNNA